MLKERLIRKALGGLRRMSPRAAERLHDLAAARRHARRGDPLRWEPIRPARESRVEPAGFVVGSELFILGGYRTLAEVSGLIEIHELKSGRWKTPVALPAGIPHTHQGVDTDGARFVYLAGGQVGPEARPCVADVSVFDAPQRTWRSLPPLPEPRYAPITRLLDGRLHVVAGARPDRFTHAADHWSLAVADGRALDTHWRPEPPIPRGGHHRASAVIDGQLYSIGGQERDVRPIPGDPRWTCDWSTPEEILYGECHAYCPRRRAWRSCAPMAEVSSHAEFSSFVHGGRLWVFGGIENRNRLKSTVQVYDPATDRWRIAGHHPYPIKGHVALSYGEHVFSFCGQRSVSEIDVRPGAVLASGWKARLPRTPAIAPNDITSTPRTPCAGSRPL